MKYVNIQKRWRTIKKHYESPEAESIWQPEMKLYSMSRAQKYNFNYTHQDRASIADYDSCDWRCGRRGPEPSYWRYVCHSACHWVCNLHLFVALRVEPNAAWRVVSSHQHSTVWDGADRLWDGNFLALGIDPEEAFDLAHNQPDSLMLPVGQPLKHPQYRLKKYRIP